MIKTEFELPDGLTIENIEIEEMKKLIIDDFSLFWQEGCGDGCINFYVDDKFKSRLMIEINDEYGMYLNYSNCETGENWLSLSDINNLDNVVEAATEIYVSIGLFLKKEIAWKAIKEFLQTGERSNEIEWVDPHIIPEGGSY